MSATVEETKAAIPDHDVALICWQKHHSHADGPIASLSILRDGASDITIEGQPFCPAWAMCEVSTKRQGKALTVSGTGVGFYREMIKLDFATGELSAEGGGMESGWSTNAVCKVRRSSSADR